MPSSEYKLRVKSSNRLGETEWTAPITSWTDDAPLDQSKLFMFKINCLIHLNFYIPY